MTQNGQSTKPLTPKVFHLLMALATEPMNGYRLGIRVEETPCCVGGQ